MSAHLGLIRSRDLNPKRSLSQNFLVHEQHLDFVLAAAELTDLDTVLEIGPGLGVLTKRLAEQAGRVVAVELDDRLFEILGETFAETPNVELVHGDILELDPVELVTAGGTRRGDDGLYKVVANLPYNITSVVLRQLLEASQSPTRLVVMVQKEVAERICAEPGQLSILAVSVQFYAHPSIVHIVPADAFYPKPKVDSAVLRLDVFPEKPLPHIDAERFFCDCARRLQPEAQATAQQLERGSASAQTPDRGSAPPGWHRPAASRPDLVVGRMGPAGSGCGISVTS
ncbi:MAG: ribosomal RNA small subunit methyltransferase A [Caldilineaceae bacterium]|nr:ribosomal RNA small subunit methyltransferase A [Caldilineaceae bacterium]